MPRILRRKHVQDTFEVNKTSLQSILADIRDGHLQLPNLQRSWRWPDENIVAILESIAISHPVGAIMQIETGGELKFQYRGFEGTAEDISERVTPSHLLLDGQQRCTSLFQACFSHGPVKVESEKKARYHRYFFDMTKVLYEEVPMSDAIISLVVDWRGVPIRKDVADYTNPEVQYEQMIFPVNEMFEFHDWDDRFHAYWEAKDVDRAVSSEASKTAREFHAVIVRAFTTCMVPVIMLKRGMDVAGVCKVYENLNSRGVALDAFDLLIAHFAAQGYCLRTDWYGPRGKTGTKAEIESGSHGIMDTLEPKQFMQAVLLAHGLSSGVKVGIEKDDLLALKLDAYIASRDSVVAGFAAACDFLKKDMVTSNTAPTTLYIVCLAAMFAHLGDRGEDLVVRAKLRRWLWTSALCLSFAAHSTRTMAEAVPDVMKWLIEDGPEPSTIVNPIVTFGDIKTAKKGGNVHRAILAALVREHAQDPSTGIDISTASNDIEFAEIPVFPLSWHKEADVPQEFVESIVNRIMVLPGKGGMMGKAAPSATVSALSMSRPEDAVDGSLATQGVDAQALRENDFAAFHAHRLQHLAAVIERITGSRVISDDDILALQARASTEQAAQTDFVPEGFLWRTSARGANVFVGARDGQYVVLAGSIMVGDAQPSLDDRFISERDRLMASGTLRQEDDDTWLLQEDYVAKSLSHAYSVFVGQKAVGKIWRDINGDICNPALPMPPVESPDGATEAAPEAAGAVDSFDGAAVEATSSPLHQDREFGSVAGGVEYVLGERLEEIEHNVYVSSTGKTVRFTKSSPFPNADYESVTVRPQYFQSDFVVIWSGTGRSWMIPTDKLRDFLECLPTTNRTSGAVSWDPRVGQVDGEDMLWTNFREHGGLSIGAFAL